MFSANFSSIKVKKISIEYSFLCSVFIFLIMTGLTSYQQLTGVYYRSNLLPVNILLEISFISLCLFQFLKRISLSDILLFLSMLLFILVSFLIGSLLSEKLINFYDFLLIYKSYLYIAMLPLIPRDLMSTRNLYFIFKILVFGLFFKYIISILLFGISRPSLFYENNFELVLPICLFCVLKYFSVPVSKVFNVMFFTSVILSLSLSAIGLLVVACFFLYSGKGFKENLQIVFIYVFLLLFSFTVFSSRIDSFDSIDRVVFFGVFLSEAEGFSTIDWLIGKPVITALQPSSCEFLSFYRSLFSSNDPNICFSVILHSFLLRTLFDHGILGLIFITSMFYYFLIRSLGDKKISALITGLVFLNGLSVSSFNNIYFLTAFLLIVSTSNSLKSNGLERYDNVLQPDLRE
jgi:hypothetical protein